MSRKPDPDATLANFRPHGSSWTVSHLDRFLQSDSGQRLFSLKPSQFDTNYSSLRLHTGMKIRPSPAFLGVPRDAPLLMDAVKRPMSAATSRRPAPEIDALNKEITAAMWKKRELESRGSDFLSPKERRKLAEAEKKQELDLSMYKTQRALLTKQQRIMVNEGKSEVRVMRPVSARPVNMQLKSSFTFNETAPMTPTRPQIRRFPEKDHNTFQTLFQPSSPPIPLKHPTPTRGFNIVTGVSN